MMELIGFVVIMVVVFKVLDMLSCKTCNFDSNASDRNKAKNEIKNFGSKAAAEFVGKTTATLVTNIICGKGSRK